MAVGKGRRHVVDRYCVIASAENILIHQVGKKSGVKTKGHRHGHRSFHCERKKGSIAVV